MLVLARRKGESIVIGVGDERIEIYVSDLNAKKVRLSVDAPRRFPVHRKEIWLAIEREKQTQGDNDANS